MSNKTQNFIKMCMSPIRDPQIQNRITAENNNNNDKNNQTF